jgi:tellurite resistance protein TehA-like permease
MTKKTIHRASADVGLVFTAYNLRRILNIIEKEALRCFLFGFLMYIVVFWALLEHFWRMQKISFKFRLKNQDP